MPAGFDPPARLVHDDIEAMAITRAHLSDDVRGINASLSLISVSVTLAMIVPIAFALIFRRYLVRGMLSGALQ